MTNKLPLVTQISQLGHEILVHENDVKINFRAKKMISIMILLNFVTKSFTKSTKIK